MYERSFLILIELITSREFISHWIEVKLAKIDFRSRPISWNYLLPVTMTHKTHNNGILFNNVATSSFGYYKTKAGSNVYIQETLQQEKTQWEPRLQASLPGAQDAALGSYRSPADHDTFAWEFGLNCLMLLPGQLPRIIFLFSWYSSLQHWSTGLQSLQLMCANVCAVGIEMNNSYMCGLSMSVVYALCVFIYVVVKWNGSHFLLQSQGACILLM